MTLAQVLKEKKELSNEVKRKYKLPLKNKALALVDLNNKALLQKLYFGLASLPIDFVVIGDFGKEGRDEQFKNIYVTKKLNKDDIKAFDFAVLDSEVTDFGKFAKSAIVPIMPKDNHLSSILQEYNSLKSEGNTYLYDDGNEWSIFYAIARYIENYKFPFDNKSLVKNVYEG